MTSTLSRHDAGEATENLTHTLPPALIRPYITGEQPLYRPGGPVTGSRTVRLADGETRIQPSQLARLTASNTLLLPTDTPPHEARHAAPTVDPQPDGYERPDRYRGTRRNTDPAWVWASIGAGSLLAGEFLAGLVVLAVAR
ncbi:hypothetical protein [Actinoplanes sp. NPDC049118]|uniref:hypothetical protein n=1 Tax=Actinoplanes sp. NPDC049118 TaxID=3155769 RepID=UPI00340773FF